MRFVAALSSTPRAKTAAGNASVAWAQVCADRYARNTARCVRWARLRRYGLAAGANCSDSRLGSRPLDVGNRGGRKRAPERHSQCTYNRVGAAAPRGAPLGLLRTSRCRAPLRSRLGRIGNSVDWPSSCAPGHRLGNRDQPCAALSCRFPWGVFRLIGLPLQIRLADARVRLRPNVLALASSNA